MRLEQVSEHCFATINERNRLCDANSGLVNQGRGVLIDTQSDLAHATQMIELFSRVWHAPAAYVINTHEDADHVWGNQLFPNAEIIAHRCVPGRMRRVADPRRSQRLIQAVRNPLTRWMLRLRHPGLVAAGMQLLDDYDFGGITLTPPTTLFDQQHTLRLQDTEVHILYVGPCHQQGDSIVHVPSEKVVFAGDTVFRGCTPMGWAGSFAKWDQCLDRIISMEPDVVVPGHGPVCDIEGVRELKAYLAYVLAESRDWFDRGISAVDAACRMDLGPYAGWNCAARVYVHVERAYREFCEDLPSQTHDLVRVFDAIYKVMRSRGGSFELSPSTGFA